MITRAEYAGQVIHEVIRNLPPEARQPDSPFPEAVVSAAYPFGERTYSPYKKWLMAVKWWRQTWEKGYRG